jgi:hypothetical protein
MAYDDYYRYRFRPYVSVDCPTGSGCARTGEAPEGRPLDVAGHN